jgi:hypothetical protein
VDKNKGSTKGAAVHTAVETKRKVIDWEAVEMQYRAGTRSLKEIGAEFGVSDAGIIKRAKRDGWARDLKAKIQAKADAKVSASLVSAEVSAGRKLTEQVVVEANANAQATVRLAHRNDISRGRRLAIALLEELEQETGNIDLFHELGELLRNEDDKGQDKRNDLYMKIISSAGRVDSMKKLADTMKTLISMEREAYGIKDEGETAVSALGELLKQVSGTGLPIVKDDADE